MKTFLLSFAFSALVVFGGCVSVAPLDTPSGRPEVTIPKVTRKQVMDVLVEQLMQIPKAQIRKADEYRLVLAAPDESMSAGIVYGSNYNRTPDFQATFTIVETAGGV